MTQPWVAVLACGVIMAGCKDTGTGTGHSPSNVIFPPHDVSFSAHVQPLFNQACNFSGCHDDGQHQSPLKLTSYNEAVFQVPGVVVPGEPDQSTLVFRIEGRVGVRMPPGPDPLDQNQINGIRTWVAEGAKNN